MNEGKNSWTVAYLSDETWKVQVNINHVYRQSTTEEYIKYKTGFVNYWDITFLMAIFKLKGMCITGELSHGDGRLASTKETLNQARLYKDLDYSPLSEKELTQFMYLEKIYNLTNGRMLSREEFDQFKRIYHALQRYDIDTVVENLKGRKASNGLTEIKPYQPQRILNRNKEFR